MSPKNSEINHVSDTALMVAACRALETESDLGFVRDPFARRLAGERGMEIRRALAHSEMFRFGIGAHTRFVDELLLDALATAAIRSVSMRRVRP